MPFTLIAVDCASLYQGARMLRGWWKRWDPSTGRKRRSLSTLSDHGASFDMKRRSATALSSMERPLSNAIRMAAFRESLSRSADWAPRYRLPVGSARCSTRTLARVCSSESSRSKVVCCESKYYRSHRLIRTFFKVQVKVTDPSALSSLLQSFSVHC
jgi:hypothetical protein